MARASRWSIGLLGGAALVLAAAGAAGLAGYLDGIVADGGISIDAPSKTFGDVKAGEQVQVTYTLTNRCRRPVRLLGGENLCDQDGCVDTIAAPVEIPPRQQYRLVVRCMPAHAGHFTREMKIYTDVPWQGTITLSIDGEVTGPTGKHTTPG